MPLVALSMASSNVKHPFRSRFASQWCLCTNVCYVMAYCHFKCGMICVRCKVTFSTLYKKYIFRESKSVFHLQESHRGHPKEIPHNEKLLSLKYEVIYLFVFIWGGGGDSCNSNPDVCKIDFLNVILLQ